VVGIANHKLGKDINVTFQVRDICHSTKSYMYGTSICKLLLGIRNCPNVSKGP
jgi:hypothetical protein